MRVLVTGANGFLGSHLVDALLAAGDTEVRVLVRPSSDLRWLEGKPVEKILGDVTAPPSDLAQAVAGIDLVFHAAGATKALDRRSYYEINQRGTQRLLLACAARTTPPSRFVLVSSAGAAGPSRTECPLREDDPPRPVTVYGRSKLAAELVARAFMRRLPITIVRPGAIYGPRDPELLPAYEAIQRGVAVRPALHPGRLNMGHVTDVARGVWLAGTVEAAASRVLFIGGKNTTQVELGRLMARALGKRFVLPVPVPGPLLHLAAAASSLVGLVHRSPRIFTFGNVRRFTARNWTLDISLARRILGYAPLVELADGIAGTVDWYRRQGWLGSFDRRD